MTRESKPPTDNKPDTYFPRAETLDATEPAPRCDVVVLDGHEIWVGDLSCVCGRLVQANDATFVDAGTRFICAACHAEVLRIDREAGW